ncbi:MAG TPA: PDZ domain-containing protein, partial [Opitutales bacterium]|nr:PDZ domain-containing protein [Opitutales bacterium]
DPERVPVEEYGSRDGRAGGILIVNVDEGSPAERAGLEEGDILVGFNGQPIQNAGELRMRISQLKPGTEVALTVVRHGEDVDLPATLGKLEEAKTELPSWELIPGLRVGELTADSREKMDLNPEVQGLLVTAVTEGFPQASLFPVGSVILEINQKSVNDIETAFSAIVEGRNRFLVLHEGAFHYLIANFSSAGW